VAAAGEPQISAAGNSALFGTKMPGVQLPVRVTFPIGGAQYGRVIVCNRGIYSTTAIYT
jgi:hypothetical protein